MNEEETQEFYQSILNEYQEEMAFADLSGQVTEFFAERYETELPAVADIVDAVGEEIAPNIIRHMAVDHFGVDDDETSVEIWRDTKLGEESAACITSVGQQVGVHMFCIGFKAAIKFASLEKSST
jgi:hypothetical protein